MVCLFWIISHSIFARRLDTYILFCYLFSALFLSSLADALVVSFQGLDAIAHLVFMFTVPAIIPIGFIFFYKMTTGIRYGALIQIWTIVPAAFSTAVLVLTLIGGLENTNAFLYRLHHSEGPYTFDAEWEKAYYLVLVVLFRIVMMVQIVVFLSYCVVLRIRGKYRLSDVADFLFRGKPVKVFSLLLILSVLVVLVVALRVVYFPFLSGHALLSALVALTIGTLFFLFGLLSLFTGKGTVALRDFGTAFRFNYNQPSRVQVLETMIADMAGSLAGESLTRVLSRLSPGADSQAPSLSSVVFSEESKSWAPGSLEARFQHLMQRQQLFLQPGLSLTDVADKLGTNKTYVSKMVNRTYNLGFPEVLNIMRIDYASEYIRQHPDAPQEEIARRSGFLSASSFNIAFKRITGYTPKVWAARKSSSSER